MAKFKYYIDTVEVFPLNKDKLIFKFSKKAQSAVVFETTLETELIFNYISGGFNFKTEEAADKCIERELVIKKICPGDTSIQFEGLFSISEGKFDNNKCTYSVKPRIKHDLLGDLKVNFLDTLDRVYEGGTYGIIANNYGSINYTQARYFDKTILYIAQKANPKIVGIISNFFQINPLVISADCIPGVPNVYKYMTFHNLSDVQNPIPSNLSTSGLVSFYELMDDLNVLFDVFWYVDSNFNLRIEHRIFFEGSPGLDLTQTKYEQYLKGTDEYTYDLTEYPKEEIWKIEGHSQSVKLLYGGVSGVKKNTNSKTYSTSVINTDYNARYNSGGSEKGLFLFATDGGASFGYWLMVTVFLNDYGLLSPEKLVKNFHTYYRPNLYSIFQTVDNVNYVFNKSGGIILNSIRPTKKQKEISVPFCCETLEAKDQVITPMGLGYLDNATLDTQTDFLKLNLLYKVDNCDNFLPSQLTGLQLWLQFNDFIKIGSAISQWNDSSGNNRHAVQTLPAAKPLYTFGGMAYFDGGRFLTTPAFQLFPGKRGTILILCRQVSGTIGIISTQGGVGIAYDLSSNLTGQYVSSSSGVIYPQNIDTSIFQNAGLFVVNRYTDVKVNTIQNSINSFNNPAVIPNDQPASNPVIIGDNTALYGGAIGPVEIMEIIIYDRSLSEFEIEQVSLYLVKKGIYNNLYP